MYKQRKMNEHVSKHQSSQTKRNIKQKYHKVKPLQSRIHTFLYKEPLSSEHVRSLKIVSWGNILISLSCMAFRKSWWL